MVEWERPNCTIRLIEYTVARAREAPEPKDNKEDKEGGGYSRRWGKKKEVPCVQAAELFVAMVYATPSFIDTVSTLGMGAAVREVVGQAQGAKNEWQPKWWESTLEG